MEFLGVRLNYKKHKDIIDWLDKFKDKERSEEARRLMRLAIGITKGESVSVKEPVIPSGPITWDIPAEPTVKAKEEDFMMNILGSFGEQQK